MMDETKWSPVLRQIYLHQDDWETEDAAFERLQRRRGLTEDVLERIMDFLVEMNLINREATGPRLTRNGFEVIRNREIQEAQIRTNHILLVFTAILAVSSLVNLVVSLI